MTNTKVGSIAAIFLIVTIMINHIILDIPKVILNTTGSSTPINIIFVSLLIIVLTLLIVKLFKKFPGSDILSVSNFLFGKWFKILIGLLFISYLLFSSGIFLRDFCECLKIIYFDRTPIYFLLAVFIGVCIYTNILGEKSIIRSTTLISPIVIISIFFILLANAKNFVPQRMLPILGYGFDETFITGTSNMYAYSCLFLIYFIPSYLKDSKAFKKVALTSIIISGIYLFICLTSLLLMFSFIATNNEIMPLYLASRYVEFGTFFQRVDAIFLFVWIIQFSLYINIVIMIVVRIFKQITNIENKKAIVIPICLLLFCCSLIPKDLASVNSFESTIYKNIIFVPLFENHHIDMATTAFFYYTEFLHLSTTYTLTLLNQ